MLIPLGALEQHGHHLPLFVDTLQVEAIAERGEKELHDEILLLPTLWLGCSHHHLDFPGTVSVVPSLYSQMIRGISECILQAGFRRLFFLNGHAGNDVPGPRAILELIVEDERADDAYITFSSWWRVNSEAIAQDKHGMVTGQLTHACEYETSMVLFLRPDLVDMDRVNDVPSALTSKWTHTEHGVCGGVSIFRRFHRLTAPGNMGSPSHATAENGESITAAVVTEVVAFLTELAA